MKSENKSKVDNTVNSLSLCFDRISDVLRDESDRGDPFGDSEISPEESYKKGQDMGRLTRAKDLISELIDVLKSVY